MNHMLTLKMADTVLTTPLLIQSRLRAKSSSSSSFSGINSSSHCCCRSYNLIRRELRDDIFFSFHVVFRSPLCRYASSQSAHVVKCRDAIFNDITHILRHRNIFGVVELFFIWYFWWYGWLSRSPRRTARFWGRDFLFCFVFCCCCCFVLFYGYLHVDRFVLRYICMFCVTFIVFIWSYHYDCSVDRLTDSRPITSDILIEIKSQGAVRGWIMGGSKA